MPADPNRAKQVAYAALEIPDAAARAAYLDRECDAELRPWVDALIWAYDRPAGLPAPSTATFPPGAKPDEGQTIDRPQDDPTSTFRLEPEADPDPNATSATPFTLDAHSSIGPRPGSAAGSDSPDVIAGKYQIIRTIGEGGMGAVYLARQSEPVKREVALKLIKRGADSRAVVARFEAERQALALMDHPNIARVYDGGTTPKGEPFFVMELVNGVPITKYCDDKRLSPKDRLELFVQVCRAVQHAHQKGIIHRDLKPGNILVTEVDGRPTPKVIDFGVAKAVEQRLTDISFNDEGVIVGTPAYMSPEQTNPVVMDIDTRTDVYALGVVLYELLVGSPPIAAKEFRRGAILEMLRMVREVEPEHLSTKASSADALPNIAASRGLEPAQLLSFLRGDVDWIVLKALEKDRDRRYESANGMAADILRYLGNEPVVARPPSRAYRLRKFVRRNRGAVLAGGLIALAVVVGVIGVIWQWREAVYQRNQADIARTDAEKNYRVALEQRKVALDTLGRMATTIRADLFPKPDVQETVNALLKVARDSLDQIIQNPEVEISLNDTTRAMLHDFRARTVRDAGDTPTALAEFAKAAEIYQKILDTAADGPDKEVVKKNLLIVLISTGQIVPRVGTQAEARAFFDKAGQVAGTIKDKSAPDFRKLLIQLNLGMGANTIDRKPREARGHYLGAFAIVEELARQETAANGKATDETRSNLVTLRHRVGNAEGRLGVDKAWEEHYSTALTIATELSAAKPGDTAHKHLLATANERMGDLYLRTKRPVDAVKSYATAAKLFQELAGANPGNVLLQADHSRILYSQGLAAVRTGANPAAAKFFQDSLAIRKARPNVSTETIAQRELMMSLARVGTHGEATTMAEVVRTKLQKDAGALIDITCCYAVCSTAAGADQATRDRYTAKAIETLQQAIAAGYGDKVNLETEPDLDTIRNHPEFKPLLDKMPEP